MKECTELDWTYDLGICSTSGTQEKKWRKTSSCEGGITKGNESIPCGASVSQSQRPSCREADWNFEIVPTKCPSTGKQTKVWKRKIDCSGMKGNEIIDCSYVASNTGTQSQNSGSGPTAVISLDPARGIAPLKAHLRATGSYDSDGTITSYEWKSNNVRIGTEKDFYYTFTKAGSYNVSLTVRDNNGNEHMANVSVVVENEAGNVPPTALMTTLPPSGDAPLWVNFDASPSHDTDGTITSYHWNFGDGRSGTQVKETRIFNREGVYPVTLTVKDHLGKTATKTMDITVNPKKAVVAVADPKPAASAPAKKPAASTPTKKPVKKTPEKKSEVKTPTKKSETKTSTKKPVTKTPTKKPETKTSTKKPVVKTPTKTSGVSSSKKRPVKVVAKMSSPKTILEGGRYYINEPISCNSRGSVAGTSAKYTWNFGDKTKEVKKMSTTHTFKKVGDYPVTLTITDEKGKKTSVKKEIRVLDKKIAKKLNLNKDTRAKINSDDFFLFTRAYGQKKGTPQYNSGADVNGDGVVNQKDFAIFILYYLDN